MAVYNKALFKVGSTQLRTYVRALAHNHSAEELDDTVMGDTHRTSAGGLVRHTLEVEMNQTYGASGPDASFATLVGQTATVTWRGSATATGTSPSTSSPQYSGSMLVTEYVPNSGSVGDQHICTVSLVNAGTITRAVST